jgi:hypothetical protein
MSLDEAQHVVANAQVRYADAVDRLVELMRGCPFEGLDERWAAAVTLVDRVSKDKETMSLLAGAAVERLSRAQAS